MTRSVPSALGLCLLMTAVAHAASGGLPDNSMPGPAVQYGPPAPSDHSAVVPGIDPPSGDDPSPGNFPVGNKNLPDGSDNPGVGNPGDGGGPATGTAATGGDRRGHYALACDLKTNGDIVLANIGNETLAGGARIKWSARGRVGYFALNADLPAGGRATASDVFQPAERSPCLASVL
jgi:hypothetical protein